MKTSIVLLTFNQLHYTKLCIDSIRKYTDKGTYEIIVVDNHSTDGTVEWLKAQEDIQSIFNEENLGFPKGCNQGMKIAQGDNILLLNNDVIVTPQWLSNLTTCLYSAEHIGAVGAVSNSCSNYQTIPIPYKVIDEMIPFAEQNNISSKDRWEERPRLIGFCMFIKKEVIEKIGLLDERFSPGNFEDDDYCFRIRKAGYKLMLCKDVFIHHFGSASFSKNTLGFGDILAINRKKFIDKWGFDAWSPAYMNHGLIDPIHEPAAVDTNMTTENPVPSTEEKINPTINHKKICFITIVNDEKIFEKTLFHIKQLNIPEGYNIEILCIKNTKSMTYGYNHGMKRSDAKYKVYLHQDVFILNKNFIKDILTIFEKYPTIGLMGVAGSKSIPSNGIWWESPHRYGKVYDSHTGKMKLLNFNEVINDYEEVKAIDGLLMITQYDIPWREDIFDSCYFYDISQSIEFTKENYKVIVPKQDQPWCIHDCGIISMGDAFEKYRQLFLEEYLKESFPPVSVLTKAWDKYDHSQDIPEDDKVICFSCLTAYHIFVAYILSKTVYKNNYKIILLSDWRNDVRKAYSNLSKLNIWNEIALLKENSQPLNVVLQQISNLPLKRIDVLHSFSWWGSEFNYHLINSVCDKTKVILTDEGLGSYYLKEADEYLNKKFNYHMLDFNKISEIWLFDKRLYVSKLKKPLRDIEFKKYLDRDLKYEICNDLNTIFEYKHEKQDWDILFLDQSLSVCSIIPFNVEKNLLMNILRPINNFKVLLKKQPHYNNLIYAGLDVNIIEQNVPWEVIYINDYIQNNCDLHNKIYMSYDSSAFFNTRTIFKVIDNTNHFISLSKLLSKFKNPSQANISLEKYYENYKQFYGTNFYEIESFEELVTILKDLNMKMNKPGIS